MITIEYYLIYPYAWEHTHANAAEQLIPTAIEAGTKANSIAENAPQATVEESPHKKLTSLDL